MNNTFSLKQISKTGNLDANLILRQYKLDIMARFMETKSNNPKLTQKQIAKSLGYSDSTVKRYRNDIKMASPYRIDDLKRPRLTPIESKIDSRYAIESKVELETTAKSQNNNTKTKRKSKNVVAGSLQSSIINEEYLDNLINK